MQLSQHKEISHTAVGADINVLLFNLFQCCYIVIIITIMYLLYVCLRIILVNVHRVKLVNL